MPSFELALTHLMRDEDPDLSGIITPEPNGGKARFGINSVANPQAVEDGFYEMPREDALEYASILYRHRYFEPAGCPQLSDQGVVNLFFDLAVNQGIKEASKLAQRACNAAVFGGIVTLSVDGVPGQRTIDAMNLGTPAQLIGEIKNYAATFYKDLAAAHPEKYSAHILAGWMRRLSN